MQALALGLWLFVPHTEKTTHLLQFDQQPVGRIEWTTQIRLEGTVASSEQIQIRRSLPGRYQLNEELTTALEDRQGRLLAGSWSRLAGERRTTVAWQVVGGHRVQLKTEGTPDRMLQVPANWLGERALGSVIARWLSTERDTLSFARLDPVAGRFWNTRLIRDRNTGVSGKLIALQASGSDGAQPITVQFDLQRQRLHWPVVRHGQTLTRLACPDPCTTHLEIFDPIARLGVAAPFRMPRTALAGRIRYLLQDGSGPALGLPNTSEQQVVQQATRTVITVCEDCGEETAAAVASIDRFRTSNAWIQSHEPEIRALLATLGSGPKPYAARTQQVTAFVRNYLDGRTEVEGYADAVTVARLRGGDCTEYAVLLAALLRADGIPTRLVAGMVYSESSGRRPMFVPHVWVQAWNPQQQRWRSLDAAAGPFGAGHVALAVGDGSPAELSHVQALMPRLRLPAAVQLPALR